MFAHAAHIQFMSELNTYMINNLTSNMIKFIILILLITFAFCVLHLVTTVEGVKLEDDKQCREYECKQPTVSDPNLKVELIHQWNGAVSSMAFLGHDILLLDKNNGTVNSTINGNVVDTHYLTSMSRIRENEGY